MYFEKKSSEKIFSKFGLCNLLFLINNKLRKKFEAELMCYIEEISDEESRFQDPLRRKWITIVGGG